MKAVKSQEVNGQSSGQVFADLIWECKPVFQVHVRAPIPESELGLIRTGLAEAREAVEISEAAVAGWTNAGHRQQ